MAALGFMKFLINNKKPPPKYLEPLRVLKFHLDIELGPSSTQPPIGAAIGAGTTGKITHIYHFAMIFVNEFDFFHQHFASW